MPARRCSRPSPGTNRCRPTGCAGTRSARLRQAPTSSTGWRPCSVNRDPADLEGVAVHLYRADRKAWSGAFSSTADGELLIIPQAGTLRIATEFGRIEVAPGSVALIPRGVRFRVAVDGPSARLCRREPRGSLPPARARPDRLQRPRQCPRFRDARRRGSRIATSRPRWSRNRSASYGRQRSTTARSTSSPGTAITRRGAMSCRASTPSARSASTIPTRRSSPCSPARATCRAAPMPISSFSRRAGWSPRTRSGRPGSTAT